MLRRKSLVRDTFTLSQSLSSGDCSPRPVSPKHCQDPVSLQSLHPRPGLAPVPVPLREGSRGRLKEHRTRALPHFLWGVWGGVPRHLPKPSQKCCWGHWVPCPLCREGPAFLCPPHQLQMEGLRGVPQNQRRGAWGKWSPLRGLFTNGVSGLGVCQRGGSEFGSPELTIFLLRGMQPIHH